MKQSGFLGPIGDDLPSLIPLLFALVLFFTSFTFAFNTFDKRNELFNTAIASLRISSAIKGDSYIESHDEFEKLCKSVGSKGVKFKAGLLNLNDNFDVFNLSFPQIPASNGKVFECENTTEQPTSNSRNLVARVYPVALQVSETSTDRFYVKPVLLLVVVWRN